MRNSFPLFQSHLDIAHTYWKALVSPGDIAIDATCGNGRDSLILANLALTSSSGSLLAIDIQQKAIEQTRSLLGKSLPLELFHRIQFIQGSHERFPDEILPSSVKLIVYNLGYLPGGDKTMTTTHEITLHSIAQGLKLICSGGALSITCYPGHAEGKVEEEKLLAFAKSLDPRGWSCTHQRWINREESPSLLIIQKACTNQCFAAFS